MRWVTCHEWHEIETWHEWHEIETWDNWHEMSDEMMRRELSDMRWVICDVLLVINWLWPYTFCEFSFLNLLVNPLLNPFLILWGQAEWRYDETWDEWHEIETVMSGRHPKNPIPILLGRRTLRVGHMLLRRGWAEVTGNIVRWLVGRGHGQKLSLATREYIGSNIVSVT